MLYRLRILNKYMNTIKKEKLKYKLKYLSVIILKLALLSILFLALAFGVYKLFKWNKIFDEKFRKSEVVKRDIVLPAILGEVFNEKKESNIAYDHKVWLESFVDKLTKSKMKVSKIEYKDYSDYNIYTINSTYIKINTKNDIEKSWNNFISSYTKSAIKEKELSDLEYVDIRFKNKIFYKLKNTDTSASTDILKVI